MRPQRHPKLTQTIACTASITKCDTWKLKLMYGKLSEKQTQSTKSR